MKKNFPAFLATADTIPGLMPLNGRRAAAQTFLRILSRHTGLERLDIAIADKMLKEQVSSIAKDSSHRGEIKFHDIRKADVFDQLEALFIPDISIGKWGAKRRMLGKCAKISFIGQIHSISSVSSLSNIERLVDEPLYEWDAVMCSSSAGRDIVRHVIESRQEFLRSHLGANHFCNIDLPVIPLPIEDRYFASLSCRKQDAREKLGISRSSVAILWIGRLSILTKADPWPTYKLLQCISESCDQEITLIECGPDATVAHQDLYAEMRRLCPNINFIRLGGQTPVGDEMKKTALAAADIGISLVDNIQETFGLSVAEAMAVGLPIIASDWNGYKDLVTCGQEGFLVPTYWQPTAKDICQSLGWQHEVGILDYSVYTGCLAQLVKIDWRSCIRQLTQLCESPEMRLRLGENARAKARRAFHEDVVANQYSELFQELKHKRESSHSPELLRTRYRSPRTDPFLLFSSYASMPKSSSQGSCKTDNQTISLDPVHGRLRGMLWHLLMEASNSDAKESLVSEIVERLI